MTPKLHSPSRSTPDYQAGQIPDNFMTEVQRGEDGLRTSRKNDLRYGRIQENVEARLSSSFRPTHSRGIDVQIPSHLSGLTKTNQPPLPSEIRLLDRIALYRNNKLPLVEVLRHATSYIKKCEADVDKALRLFNLLLLHKIRPNRINYSALISVCAEGAKHKPHCANTAMTLLDSMRNQGIKPTAAVYHLAIRTCARAAEKEPRWADTAIQLLDRMLSENLAPYCSTYIDAFSACQIAAADNHRYGYAALRLLTSTRCPPCIDTYNTVILVLQKAAMKAPQCAVDALELLAHMTNQSVQPDARTRDALILTCEIAASVDVSWYRHMQPALNWLRSTLVVEVTDPLKSDGERLSGQSSELENAVRTKPPLKESPEQLMPSSGAMPRTRTSRLPVFSEITTRSHPANN